MEKAQGAERSKSKSKLDANADMTTNSSEVVDENVSTEKEVDMKANFNEVATADEHGRVEKVANADENIKVETHVEVSGNEVTSFSLFFRPFLAFGFLHCWKVVWGD